MSAPRPERPVVEVVITGGGTAGHVLPAIAVARALVTAGHPSERIRFIGSRRGMEAQLVPAAGFRAELLPGRGIVRRASAANLLAIAGLTVALLQAAVLMARWRPGAVVMVGGYAGAPATLAAILFGIPVVVVNVDAVPGAANRLAGRFAAVCAVALPGTPLRRAVVTGVPLRPEVLAVAERHDRMAARAELGLPRDTAVVAVTGGSLGARRLNDAALGLANALAGEHIAVAGATGADTHASPGRTVVYHVTGRRDHDRVLAEATADGCRPDYVLVGFEERMPQLLTACDLLVSRAGASTIAEVCALGAASVLVPLPGAPSDHQRRNAEVLVAAGAAVLLEDAACTPEQLTELVAGLLADPSRLESMAGAARGLGRLDAAERVAELVERAGRWR